MNELSVYQLPDSFYEGKKQIYVFIEHNRIDGGKWRGLLVFDSLEECSRYAISRVLYYLPDYENDPSWDVINTYANQLTIEYVVNYVKNNHSLRFGYDKNPILECFNSLEIRELNLIQV